MQGNFVGNSIIVCKVKKSVAVAKLSKNNSLAWRRAMRSSYQKQAYSALYPERKTKLIVVLYLEQVLISAAAALLATREIIYILACNFITTFLKVPLDWR